MALDDLFPEVLPYYQNRLKVSEIHTLYIEQCGNPAGKPIVFLHGGPGSGISSSHRRFFDPAYYKIILFDQRGSGGSTPSAEFSLGLFENTTQDLVSDMEKIRSHLGIDRWMLFGGSWGSTLALTYAVSHPERVTGLILRGVFLCSESEIHWFYEQGGAHQLFPDAWEDYIAPISGVMPGKMVETYYHLLNNADKEVGFEAALAWSRWEALTSALLPNP